MDKKIRFTHFLPALGWLVLLTHLLTLPGNAFPKTRILHLPYTDKLAHALFFALLAFLFYLPWRIKKFEGFDYAKACWIGLLVTAYGLLMEYVQREFVALRSFDWWDVVADAVGAFAPMLWYAQWRKNSSLKAKTFERTKMPV